MAHGPAITSGRCPSPQRAAPISAGLFGVTQRVSLFQNANARQQRSEAISGRLRRVNRLEPGTFSRPERHRTNIDIKTTDARRKRQQVLHFAARISRRAASTAGFSPWPYRPSPQKRTSFSPQKHAFVGNAAVSRDDFTIYGTPNAPCFLS
jgi:hypothetical protein